MAISKTDVLIIGGGVAGLAAAAELARRGVGSLVVEKGPALGGAAARFCCKALAACARCGACRLGDLLDAAGGLAGLEALTRAVPVSARPVIGGGWEVDLAPAPAPAPADATTAQALVQSWAPAQAPVLAAPLAVRAGAVILACGYAPFDTRTKTRFGHGRVPGVLSALELEQALAGGGPDPLPKRAAFIQCVGSRDPELGRPWCSRVCCGFGLRLARLLKARAEGAEVTFFHMDVQGYGRAWEAELPAMRGELRFIRAMPGEVVRGAEGGAEVVWAGPEGLAAREEFDLVVLSQGLGPAADAESLAGLFQAGRSADGFLEASGAAGVFVAGAARGPLSIAESITHAALAAEQAARFLLAGGLREGGHV